MSDDIDELFGRTSRGSFVERYAPPKVPQAPENQPVVLTDEYRAFGTTPSGQPEEVCVLRRWLDGTNIPSSTVFKNRFLMRTDLIGDDEIRLLLVDCIVVLTGRGFTEEICQRFTSGAITYAQQFNCHMWRASPQNSPVVEKIDIVKMGS